MQHSMLSDRRRGRVMRRALFLSVLFILALGTMAAPSPTLAAPVPPPNFQVTPVFTGLKNPTDFRFAPDGRVFVAEKAGLIKVFDSLADTTATVFADMQTQVYKGPNDHGILGLALDPQFATRPYVYVLYTYDAPTGGTAPTWNDVCPDPPGPNKNGCVVSGRLSRLQANGNQATGAEQVLVEGWCQQFTSHSIGTVAFGADGALYASAGEGANTSSGDYGQLGYTDLITYTSITPVNPCGDPPTGVGVQQTRPSARGGALRAQSLRRPAGEPALLSGTVIRVDPDTGAGLPDNPLASSTDANARRVVAYGLRNPFRFTIRPGTNEVWIGDVGWGKWEEIDRIANPTGAGVPNFGWPCYEGDARQPVYDGFNLTMCEDLYSQPDAVAAPYYAYSHRESMAPGDGCSETVACTSAISGLAFYSSGQYPASYNGALFFADYGRHGIWVMFRGANGLPDPATRTLFISGANAPVSLQIGPNGDLFYADITGTIYRVQYFAGNQPPSASISATPTSGAAPLNVAFDARGSTDADGDALTYAWDLDGDGQYDDATTAQPSYSYTQVGTYIASLRVTDTKGATSTASVTISVGNTPPTAVIDTPQAGMLWKVGDTISFAGHATDAQQGNLPASALVWTIVLHHCYRVGDCHEHLMEELSGADGTVTAEDHEDLPVIELRLTATDAGGLSDTASVILDPLTTTLALRSNPANLRIAVDTDDVVTPAELTVVANSTHLLLPPAVQEHQSFDGWSDGVQVRIRSTTLGTAPATYSATYRNRPPSAQIKVVPGSASAALSIAFDGTLSSDPEGDQLIYWWHFGDQTDSSEAIPTHTYAKPGTYQISLTATDQLGASGTSSTMVKVPQGDSPGTSHVTLLPLIMR